MGFNSAFKGLRVKLITKRNANIVPQELTRAEGERLTVAIQ